MAPFTSTANNRHHLITSQLLILLLLIVISVKLVDHLARAKSVLHTDGKDGRVADLTGRQQHSKASDDCKQEGGSHGTDNSATRQYHHSGQVKSNKEHDKKLQSGQLESFSMEATGLGDLEEPDAIRIMMRRRTPAAAANNYYTSKTGVDDLDKTISNAVLARSIRSLIGSPIVLSDTDKRIDDANRTIFHLIRKPKVRMNNVLLDGYYNLPPPRAQEVQLLPRPRSSSNQPQYKQSHSPMRPLGTRNDIFTQGDSNIEAINKLIKLTNVFGHNQPRRADTLTRFGASALSGGNQRNARKYTFETEPIIIDRRTVESTFNNDDPDGLSADTSDGHQQEILNDDNINDDYSSRFSLLTMRKIQPDEIIIDGSTIDMVNDDENTDQDSIDRRLINSRAISDSGEQQSEIAQPALVSSSQTNGYSKSSNHKQNEESLEQLLKDPILISSSSNYLPRIARASFM